MMPKVGRFFQILSDISLCITLRVYQGRKPRAKDRYGH